MIHECPLNETERCLKCLHPGHISRDCPRKAGSTEYGRPAPTQAPESSATTEKPKEDRVKELIRETAAILTTQKAKQQYFDLLVKKGFI